MDYWPIITGPVQGFGMGFFFVPLSSMALGGSHPAFAPMRTSMFSLVRWPTSLGPS